MYNLEKEVRERGILVGLDLDTSDQQRWSVEDSLDELKALLETAGGQAVARVIQKKDSPDPAYFVGRGKLEEIKHLVKHCDANLVVFDEELSPAQQRNIERALEVKVIDRTGLILDIFANHARTREGKIQVELAQLRYLLPRLYGRGEALSRLGGGIGTRGPGETKLEVDQRRIRRRIANLNQQLEEVQKHRRQQRKNRSLPLVSLVGYTNAGKSTLLNTLTGAGVDAEDKLFATLDPTTRRVEPESGHPFLLSDTVGFIQKLPHRLIAAFRATLEEVREADLILHIVAADHPDFLEQMGTVIEVLRELDALNVPRITVFNKLDKVKDLNEIEYYLQRITPSLSISALKGINLDLLLEEVHASLSQQLVEVTFLFPFTAVNLISTLYERAFVKAKEYIPEGIKIKAEVEPWLRQKYSRYLLR